jgi:hypothetical protein
MNEKSREAQGKANRLPGAFRPELDTAAVDDIRKAL